MHGAKDAGTGGARARVVWTLAGSMVVLGLLLLNVDTVGRLAIRAYQGMQTEQDSAPGPVPHADTTVPASPLDPRRAPSAANRRTDVSPPAIADSRSHPQPGAADGPADAPPPSLERLYPAPPPIPAGRAGLVMLVRAGALRPASGNDLAHWKMRYASNNPAGVARAFDDWTRSMPVYVVLGDMTIPEGLAGANAVVFVLGDKAPFPTGDPGHSIVLDPATGTCTGTLCRILLDG